MAATSGVQPWSINPRSLCSAASIHYEPTKLASGWKAELIWKLHIYARDYSGQFSVFSTFTAVSHCKGRCK